MAPAAGSIHDLEIVKSESAACNWRFRSMSGVEKIGVGDEQHVRLKSLDGAPAELVLEKPFGTKECAETFDDGYPPCLLESEEP